jgi:hypothetical protein
MEDVFAFIKLLEEKFWNALDIFVDKLILLFIIVRLHFINSFYHYLQTPIRMGLC